MIVREKNTKGMTLIEILIAMVIGGIILAGGVAVYGDQVQSSRRLAAYSQLQESGRVALDIIEKDLRTAGFRGCLSTDHSINSLIDGAPNTFQPEVGIQGWEAPSSSTGQALETVTYSTEVVDASVGGWLTSGGNNIDVLTSLPSSDIIRIWSAGDEDMPVQSIGYGTTPVADVPNIYEVEAGAIYLLSDCTATDLVQACSAGISGSNLRLTFSDSCSPGNNTAISIRTKDDKTPSLTRLVGVTYVVSKLNGNAANPPALFRAELNTSGATIGNPQELVQGVESMQILYGENLNNDNYKSADVYVTAENVTNWNNVISVRVSILLQSIENNMAQGIVPYTFNGVTYDGEQGNPSPSDNRLRRVFTRTITLRNRTLGS